MPNPTPNDRIIEQLTRIADALEAIQLELDHNHQHSFAKDLVDQMRHLVHQGHR
jgi:hypothetical protein